MRISTVLLWCAGIALTAPISRYANDASVSDRGLTKHQLDAAIMPDAHDTVDSVVEAVQRDLGVDESGEDDEAQAVRTIVAFLPTTEKLMHFSIGREGEARQAENYQHEQHEKGWRSMFSPRPLLDAKLSAQRGVGQSQRLEELRTG